MDWPDFVFVMEKEHKERIKETFGFIEKKIVVLEIPDEYEYMDEELVQMLKDAVPPYLD